MNKHEWFLSTGKVLYDDEALEYMINKQLCLNRCILKIKSTIKEIDKFASTTQVIGDDTPSEGYTTYNTLFNTLENLSIIEILLEELLKELRRNLNND